MKALEEPNTEVRRLIISTIVWQLIAVVLVLVLVYNLAQPPTCPSNGQFQYGGKPQFFEKVRDAQEFDEEGDALFFGKGERVEVVDMATG